MGHCQTETKKRRRIRRPELFFSSIVIMSMFQFDLLAVKMQSASILFTSVVHAAESSSSSNENNRMKTGKGSVIMIRGDVVTIRLDQKKRSASIGDRVELSFSVDGEVIPVGTWRVSALKEDGTVEALPFEIKGQPNIGMDAILFAQEERPQTGQKLKPSEKEKGSTVQPEINKNEREKTPVEKEPKPKSIEEILASYSKTAVPIAFPGAGESLPCDSGTIRIHKDKVEMSASGESKWEPCIFKVSDELFKNFFATFKLTVDTNSHHHFHAGIVYGTKPGGVHESDSIRGNILALSSKTSTGLFKSSRFYLSHIKAKHPSKDGKGRGETIEKFLPGDSNPTPGLLALMKTDQTCRIFWNGEEIGSWEEGVVSNGHLWLEFMAHGKGTIRAAFEDIHIYRLQ